MSTSSRGSLSLNSLDLTAMHEVCGPDPFIHLFSVMDMNVQRELANTSSIFNRIFKLSIRNQLFNKLHQLLVKRKISFISDRELNNLGNVLSNISSADIDTLIYHLKYPYRTLDEKEALFNMLKTSMKARINYTFIKIMFDIFLSDAEYVNRDSFVFDQETIQDIEKAIYFIAEYKHLFYLFPNTSIFLMEAEIYQMKIEQIESGFNQGPVRNFLFYLLINKLGRNLDSGRHLQDRVEHIKLVEETAEAYRQSILDQKIYFGTPLETLILIDSKATDYLIKLIKDLNICAYDMTDADPCKLIRRIMNRKVIDDYCAQNNDDDSSLTGAIVKLLASDRYAYTLKEQIEKLDLMFNQILGQNIPSLKYVILIYLIRSNQSVSYNEDKITAHLCSFKKLLFSMNNDEVTLAKNIISMFNEVLEVYVTGRYQHFIDILLHFKFNYEYKTFWEIITKNILAVGTYLDSYNKLEAISFLFEENPTLHLIDPADKYDNMDSVIEFFTHWLLQEDLQQDQYIHQILYFAKCLANDEANIRYDHALFKNKKFWDIFIEEQGLFDDGNANITDEVFLILLKNNPQMINKLDRLIKFSFSLKERNFMQNVIPNLNTHLSDSMHSILFTLLKLPYSVVEYTAQQLESGLSATTLIFSNTLIKNYCHLFARYGEFLNQAAFRSFINALDKQPPGDLIDPSIMCILEPIFAKLADIGINEVELLSAFLREKMTLREFYQALCPQPTIAIQQTFFSASPTTINENNKRPHDGTLDEDEPTQKIPRTSPSNDDALLSFSNHEEVKDDMEIETPRFS